MLAKTIGLTIRDYKIAMTSPLKFFEEDDLELIFTVGEFGAKVVNDEQDSEVYTPMFPKDAILFVETPKKVSKKSTPKAKKEEPKEEVVVEEKNEI